MYDHIKRSTIPKYDNVGLHPPGPRLNIWSMNDINGGLTLINNDWDRPDSDTILHIFGLTQPQKSTLEKKIVEDHIKRPHL